MAKNKGQKTKKQKRNKTQTPTNKQKKGNKIKSDFLVLLSCDKIRP